MAIQAQVTGGGQSLEELTAATENNYNLAIAYYTGIWNKFMKARQTAKGIKKNDVEAMTEQDILNKASSAYKQAQNIARETLINQEGASSEKFQPSPQYSFAVGKNFEQQLAEQMKDDAFLTATEFVGDVRQYMAKIGHKAQVGIDIVASNNADLLKDFEDIQMELTCDITLSDLKGNLKNAEKNLEKKISENLNNMSYQEIFGFQAKSYKSLNSKVYTSSVRYMNLLNEQYKVPRNERWNTTATWRTHYAICFGEAFLSDRLIQIIGPTTAGIIYRQGLISTANFLKSYVFTMSVYNRVKMYMPQKSGAGSSYRGGGEEIKPKVTSSNIHMSKKNGSGITALLTKEFDASGARIEKDYAGSVVYYRSTRRTGRKI